jgi:hypothetical protein
MAEAVEVARAKRQPDRRWLLDRILAGSTSALEGGAGEPSRWNTLCAAGARLVARPTLAS